MVPVPESNNTKFGCSPAFSKEKNIRYFYVLLIVDEEEISTSYRHQQALEEIVNQEHIIRGLPHYNDVERKELFAHLLAIQLGNPSLSRMVFNYFHKSKLNCVIKKNEMDN